MLMKEKPYICLVFWGGTSRGRFLDSSWIFLRFFGDNFAPSFCPKKKCHCLGRQDSRRDAVGHDQKVVTLAGKESWHQSHRDEASLYQGNPSYPPQSYPPQE